MLPSKPPTASSLASAGTPLSAATASVINSQKKTKRKLLAEKLTLGDWDAILELTVLARRHVEGWKLKGGSVGPFGSTQTASRAKLTEFSTTSLNTSVYPQTNTGSRTSALSSTRSSIDMEMRRRPEENSFNWSVVIPTRSFRELPHHRARVLSEVIVPLARNELENERDEKISEDIRNVLVDGAAACGAQMEHSLEEGQEGGEGEIPKTNPSILVRDDEHVFVEIRQLLTRLAKGNDSPNVLWLSNESSAHASSANAHAHGHVSSTCQSVLTIDPSQTLQRSLRITEEDQVQLNFFWVPTRRTPFSPKNRTNSEERDGRNKSGKAALASSETCSAILKPPSSTSQQQQSNNGSLRARLVALQWLVRLRTDRHHRVYLVGDMDELVASSASVLLRGAHPEGEGLGASNANAPASTAMEASGSNDSRIRSNRPVPSRTAERKEKVDQQVQLPWMLVDPNPESETPLVKEGWIERGSEKETGLVVQVRIGAKGGWEAGSLNRWSHYGSFLNKYLSSFQHSSLRSDLVFTYMHEADAKCGGHSHALLSSGEAPAPLPISEFLMTAVDILSIEREWEIVSYLICHLPHQLANKHLFCGPKAQVQILALRQFLCSGLLKASLVPDVGIPDGVKKTDVYAVSYSMLTVLISYRTLFNRSQQDELVEAFIAGLNKSQATALPCVRALSVACYELQKSTTRLLPGMLVKLSTVMSSMTMSVHILELMVAIGHIPSCYANFTEGDYKRVFGIALQYIQYLQSPAALTREDPRSSPASFTLSQYVMMLAYYCIALWFMSLRIGDRPKHVAYIARGLLLAHEGRESLSDQTEVIFEFLISLHLFQR
ncbi:hypothetical protein L7F22_012292 [Adiantum nelumboides]|nr:hypothetical protein [Adiantum nelumboides]